MSRKRAQTIGGGCGMGDSLTKHVFKRLQVRGRSARRPARDGTRNPRPVNDEQGPSARNVAPHCLPARRAEVPSL